MSFLNNPTVENIRKHFNSPAGKEAMDSLEEGDSFTLGIEHYSFRITKKKGRAVVEKLRTNAWD